MLDRAGHAPAMLRLRPPWWPDRLIYLREAEHHVKATLLWERTRSILGRAVSISG